MKNRNSHTSPMSSPTHYVGNSGMTQGGNGVISRPLEVKKWLLQQISAKIVQVGGNSSYLAVPHEGRMRDHMGSSPIGRTNQENSHSFVRVFSFHLTSD